MIGAAVGLAIGGGACLLWSWQLSTRVSITNRVRPYLGGEQELRSGPLLALWKTLIATGLQGFTALGSTQQSVVKRQLQLLQKPDVVDFRLRQMGAAASGMILGCALPLLLWKQSLLVSALAGLTCGIIAAISLDRLLTRRVRKFQLRVTAQLPDAIELLALTVSAGESVGAGILRVENNLASPLRQIFVLIRSQQERGLPLADALRSVAQQLDCQAVERVFVALATAIDRGSPLAEVLHAIATDAREQRRRELMEVAGKKEILMLIPVVFLILPLTVLFALYPGLLYIRTL